MKKIVIHIILMILTAILLGWAAMMWLNVWTRHDSTLIVPSVKSLTYQEALDRLNEKGLVAVLADSIYDTKAKPGTVMEQNPKSGNKVKEGREVYLTINAFSPKMVNLPSLTDMSVRQARSILEGLEIRNIKETKVMSEYKDLVVAVKYKGQKISAGARVPVNGTIELEVGQGLPDDDYDTISTVSPALIDQLDLFN